MKIAVFDPYGYKFSKPLIDHWKRSGHQVKMTLYYDPKMVKWADITYFETVDNNLHTFCRDCDEGLEHNSKIIARLIDIEAWVGHHNGVKWEYVDDVVFIAKHIMEKVLDDLRELECRAHIIPCGVDADKFSFNPRRRSKKIAWVGERWHGKNPDLAIMILRELLKDDKDWRMYMLGGANLESWYDKYLKQLMLPCQENLIVSEVVQDIDSWYNKSSYHLLTSKKEAFSYVTAEAMCKGLKPVIHNFYGAEDIWAKKYIFNTPSEAIQMLTTNHNPNEYREYIMEKYPLSKMLQSFDKLL